MGDSPVGPPGGQARTDMTTTELMAGPTDHLPCVSLIGMAGAGKSTIGLRLANELGWAFLDSDHLLEALYAARLQDVTDALGKEAFLDAESAMICSIRAHRAVIATGGSVVYRPAAMRHLASLGPVVHLDVPLAEVMRRIARNPQRGLAIGPGQSIADIYNERAPLYARWRTLRCDAARQGAGRCARQILRLLSPEITGLAPDAGGTTKKRRPA